MIIQFNFLQAWSHGFVLLIGRFPCLKRLLHFGTSGGINLIGLTRTYIFLLPFRMFPVDSGGLSALPGSFLYKYFLHVEDADLVRRLSSLGKPSIIPVSFFMAGLEGPIRQFVGSFSDKVLLCILFRLGSSVTLFELSLICYALSEIHLFGATSFVGEAMIKYLSWLLERDFFLYEIRSVDNSSFIMQS